MTATLIRLRGCDDATSAVVDLTPEQAEAVRLVADAINANSYSGCMPTMRVREATAEDIATHEADQEQARKDNADD